MVDGRNLSDHANILGGTLALTVKSVSTKDGAHNARRFLQAHKNAERNMVVRNFTNIR